MIITWPFWYWLGRTSYQLAGRETMSGLCTIAYTLVECAQASSEDSQTADRAALELILQDASAEEIRWWAAVLAPGQGWQAHMKLQHKSYASPWSVDFQADCRFVLRHTADDQSSPRPAASLVEALTYLDKFCSAHQIIDQSHTALGAVLLLPSMGSAQALSLPRLVYAGPKPSPLGRHESSPQLDWIKEDRNIDRLLTFSCNVRDIKPMLLSVFYEPSIECNAVTPWLQGTSASFQHLAGSESYMAIRLCIARTPALAFLWLGSFVLDVHPELLQQAYVGMILIDLLSAAWSGTVQTFIQHPVTEPLIHDGSVLRADECKLLFLYQPDSHTRLPLCQWKPFRFTPFEDTDIEVRTHRACKHHQLAARVSHGTARATSISSRARPSKRPCTVPPISCNRR